MGVDQLMLGEMIGEFKGTVTGYRVLPPNGDSPIIEVSVQLSGKILGTNASNMVTYRTYFPSPKVIRGEGDGIIKTEDGDMATYKGSGVAKHTGSGTANFRGAIFCQSTSEKLKQLNSIATVFEYDVDENGNASGKFWEWK